MSVNKTENMENINNNNNISNINNSTNSNNNNNNNSPITINGNGNNTHSNNINKQRSDNPEGGQLPYCFLRGSDPRAATCRGKLQNRRCKLNQEINKELRLRAGAENLYKATTNRKLRETVALELSFVNSNLQLLKEQMSELNSSVEIYQNDSYEPIMPMIPLGLKETKEVNFMEPFSDFILEHYSENANYYEDAIADIVDTRQAARTPTRDTQGVSLLFRYYNLLYYVERRFFPPDRSLGVYFEWYDSLTGVPSCQRTVAFEKACILFNLGGIYTQIGAKHDRTSEKGLDAAVDSFLRAAGIFKHIHETFTNAPSMDLKPQVLEILVSMMLAQARECLYEKLQLQIEHISIKDTNHIHRDLSGEAAQLTDEYNKIHSIIQTDDIHTYIPECWTGFVSLKSEYYKSLSHYHKAKSISVSPSKLNGGGLKSKTPNKILDNNKESELINKEVMKVDNFIYDDTILDQNCCPYTLKLAHIKEALACLEEAQRLQRMCRDLKSKTSLTRHLKESHLKVLVESDFMDDVDVKILEEDYEFIDVQITACSKFTLSLTGPDFTAFKVEDPFKKLGPIAIFSAKRHWTVPRQVRLQKGTRTKNYQNNIQQQQQQQQITKCKCKRSDHLFEQSLELQCEVCLKYTTTTPSSPSSLIDSSNSVNNQLELDQMLKTTSTTTTTTTTTQQITINNQNSIESYGFHIRGDSPVIISNVEINSLADLGGIKEGDFIVEISGIDVKWYTNRQVSKLIQNANMSLDMKIITPMDRNYLKPVITNLSKGSLSTRSIGSSSGVSSGSPSPTGTTTSKSKNRGGGGGGTKSSTKSKLSSLSGSSWNPFRRSQSVGNF